MGEQNMACKLQLDTVENEDKIYLQDALLVGDECCYDFDADNLYLPFHFGFDTFEVVAKDLTANFTGNFKGQLRPEQEVVFQKALTMLKTTKCSVIACYPGFGKTITAICLGCALGLKTLIVINKVILVAQWKEAIEKFTTHKVQYLDHKHAELEGDAQFYIINAINMRKHDRYKFNAIKFVIVDELHQIVTKVLSQNLLYVTPSCILGLSATPYRFDEYNKAIPWFFGSGVIGKNLKREHIVYYVESSFVPEIKYAGRKLDWNAVLQSQAGDGARNELIINTILKFPERAWLVLVKRVAHATALMDILTARGIKCETLLGNKVEFDKTVKILIGTTSKIGVGFDHADIDALCVAADVKNYFVQFLGRCMRRKECVPIVVDVLDKFSVLQKHFREREATYKKHGGVVTKFRQ